MVKNRKAPVYRITVDERLSNDLVRLLIAPLVAGVDTFADRDKDWGPEEEVMVNSTTYARQMGVREAKLPWHTLAEGQVFLVGHFKTVGARAAPEGFQVRPGPGGRTWLRIDNLSLVKEPAKQLYSALIRREEG